MSTNQSQAVRTRNLTRGLGEDQREAFLAARTALGSYRQTQKAMARIARAVVELRLTFKKGGQPDYSGESAKYRELVSALYEQVIPDDEERALFKSAIRYWIKKEIAQRVEEGQIDRSVLGERFTAASIPPPVPADSNGNGNSEERNRMEQILADLAPRTAIREAGNALAARVDVVGVIPTLKAVNVALEAVAAEMDSGGVSPSKALERTVSSLVDRALELAEKANVNVLERLAKQTAA